MLLRLRPSEKGLGEEKGGQGEFLTWFARLCKNFTHIISFNLHANSVRPALLVVLYCRLEN